MNTLIRAIAGLALTTLVLAQTPGVVGTWRAEFTGPGGTAGSETLDLSVKDGVASGTFTPAVGGSSPIRDGKWDGTTLRFWVQWDPGRLEAVGKVVGATLEVDLKTSRWTAKRVFNRVAKGK
jgi:hypothetical protein